MRPSAWSIAASLGLCHRVSSCSARICTPIDRSERDPWLTPCRRDARRSFMPQKRARKLLSRRCSRPRPTSTRRTRCRDWGVQMSLLCPQRFCGFGRLDAGNRCLCHGFGKNSAKRTREAQFTRWYFDRLLTSQAVCYTFEHIESSRPQEYKHANSN